MSLVIADLVQAIGGMPNWKWMLDAHLTEGSLCTFQSLFLNMGNVAIALSILSIALHTFFVLILRWRVSRKTLRIVVAGIWCLTALIVGVCNRGQKHYYGDTGYWCWITQDHPIERIAGEYVWLWISFFVMIGLYVFMFLVMRGIVKMPNDVDDGGMTEEEQEEKHELNIAYLMLFYPAVYLICIAPVSISRWIDWSRPNHHPPPAAIIFSNTIFSLSGVFNVILFSITRPTLVRGSAESLVHPEQVEMGPHGRTGTAAGPSHCHCQCHSQASEPTAGRSGTSTQTANGHHHARFQPNNTTLTAYLGSHNRPHLPE